MRRYALIKETLLIRFRLGEAVGVFSLVFHDCSGGSRGRARGVRDPPYFGKKKVIK